MSRIHLANRRDAQICTFKHDDRVYRATYGYFNSGNLAEIFLDIGRPDSALQQHADDSAILGLLLQHGVAPCTISRIDCRTDPHCVGYLARRTSVMSDVRVSEQAT